MIIENSPELDWERVGADTERAKVFGGWLVLRRLDVLVSLHEDMQPQHGYEWRETMCFVPDVNHEWGIR